MNGKGARSRVSDRARYERNKERIFMSTVELAINLGSRLEERLNQCGDDDGRICQWVLELEARTSRPGPWGNEQETWVKEIRHRLFEIHRELDEVEECHDQT